jgi:hypothetical protein
MYVRVYVFMWVCTHARNYVCMHACMYVCVCKNVCMCVCVYTHIQIECPLPKMFGTISVSDFGFCPVLEHLHIHHGISWGMGPKSEYKIHLCFTDTYVHSPKVTLHNIFTNFAHEQGFTVWNVPLMASWQQQSALGFGAFWILHFQIRDVCVCALYIKNQCWPLRGGTAPLRMHGWPLLQATHLPHHKLSAHLWRNECWGGIFFFTLPFPVSSTIDLGRFF